MNYVAKNDAAKNIYINEIAKFSKNVNLSAVRPIGPTPEIHTNKTCLSKYLRKICMFIFLCTTLYALCPEKWKHSILPLTLPSDLAVISGNNVNKYPTIPQTRCYTTLYFLCSKIAITRSCVKRTAMQDYSHALKTSAEKYLASDVSIISVH